MKNPFKNRAFLAIGAVMLAVAFTFLACSFALTYTASDTRRLTVVLDAGHGGVDGGVVGISSGVKESDVNLSVSRYLQEKLEDAGLNVVQTRLTEAGLYGAATPGYKRRDMQKRAEIIKKSSPALVISVHQNYFSASYRRGAQVFFRADHSQSYSLACMMQSSLNGMSECVKKTQPLAGDYYLLNCSDYPSVIVEGGFLSNEEDEKLLVSEEYQKKLATAICEGALAFLSATAIGAK